MSSSVAQILQPKGIVVPQLEILPSHLLRLRWRFDFADGRKKCGAWDQSSPHEGDSATRVNKTGLIRASIEGESRLTGEESVIVECQGQDYVFFQVETYARIPNVFGICGDISPPPVICGLIMFTRHERILVEVNGQVSSRPLTEDEAKFKFNEFKA